MSYKRMLLRSIRDLINLGHFDPIIQMIPLTVIPLRGAHCSTLQNKILKKPCLAQPTLSPNVSQKTIPE
jgi:hypothetical protein